MKLPGIYQGEREGVWGWEGKLKIKICIHIYILKDKELVTVMQWLQTEEEDQKKEASLFDHHCQLYIRVISLLS